MNNKYRILVVHNKYQIAGGEDTVVRNEVAMLKSHGHEVFLYERNNSEINHYSVIQKLGLPFSMIYSFKTAKEVGRIIKENNINIVHVHNTLLLVSPSVYYTAKKLHIPVVQTIHNFRLLCPNALLYRDGHICEDCINKGLSCAVKHNCYRNSKLQTFACVISMMIHKAAGIYSNLYYVCLTEFNKQKLLSRNDIKEENVFIKPNFSKPLLSERKEIKDQYLFIGRLDRTKGIVFLLEAWKELGENAPELVIYGTGPEEEWCRNYITDNQLPVTLKGYRNHDEIIEAMRESKALIFPTKWYEGFPMVIAEAYSAGLPVFGSNLGNTADIIIEGVTGWKFDPTDIHSLISALQNPLPDREGIRKHFLEHYTEETNYQTLMDIYYKVLL